MFLTPQAVRTGHTQEFMVGTMTSDGSVSRKSLLPRIADDKAYSMMEKYKLGGLDAQRAQQIESGLLWNQTRLTTDKFGEKERELLQNMTITEEDSDQ